MRKDILRLRSRRKRGRGCEAKIMVPRLSRQTSISGVVSFASKFLLGIEKQNKLDNFPLLTRKPWNHDRILIHQTWSIGIGEFNLVPRVSHVTVPWGERRETLIEAGHMSARIWEITIKLLKEGAP